MIKDDFYLTRKTVELLRSEIKTHLVAVFKDYLIYDDIYDFFSEMYDLKESADMIKRHAAFYNSLKSV